MIQPAGSGGMAVKRVIAGVLAAAALATAACGAGYDDFTRGMTENLRGKYENAIAAFTAALASPDLVATYRPVALRGRAEAYLALDRCWEALADLNAYEGFKGLDRKTRLHRIWSELCLKDSAAALRDATEQRKGKLTPDDLFSFARLQSHYGLYDDAMKTSAEAFAGFDKANPDAAYLLLWQAFTAHRAGKSDAVAIVAGLALIKLDGWPKPVFDLYLGQQTPEGVRQEAKSWRSSKNDAQMCEANFYTAQWHLGRSEKDAAVPLLLAVAKDCPIDFIELPAARAELKRLGVPLPKE
jgi:tetratricopeptide (TPR) repeat protein